MNLTEKILAAHCGKSQVRPGEIVNVKVDLIYSMDVAAPLAISEFQKIGARRVFDPKKIIFVPQCLEPATSIHDAETLKNIRQFVQGQGIIFFELGRGGVSHSVIPDKGYLVPGDIFIGGDSHTCQAGAIGVFATGMGSTDIAAAMATGETWMKVPATIKFEYHGRLKKWVTAKDLILHTIGDIGVDGATYKAMEFHGEVIDKLPMDGRFTMANMSMEAGAKVGLCEADDKTLEYLKPRTKRPLNLLRADPGAEYEQVIEYDVSSLEPQVAFPYMPSNVKPISEAAKMKIDIQQVVIGLCVNGRISDLAVAAEILQGRKVHPNVRCIVCPNSQDIYLQAMQQGFIKTFVESGAAVTTPSCAPCAAHQGTLASGERLVSTGNRNFVGRMGHQESEIYLVGPAVAAASAILGRIADPMEVIS